MGRFAQVLHIGVKGTVDIELLKSEFYAGEYVVGHVKLHVKTRYDADAIVLTLAGKEHLSWHTHHGKSTQYHYVKNEILRQQIPLVAQPTTFQSGEVIFPFQFQLPHGLPSSFSMNKSRIAHHTRIRSTVGYKLEVEVKVKGMLKANISGKSKIGVHALPFLSPQPAQLMADQATRSVYFMCCFNQGTCRLSGSISVNFVDLGNGAVKIQSSVRNDTSREISAIYARLYQDFTIHPYNNGHRHSTSRLLHEVKLEGVAPGASKDKIIADISIAAIVADLAQKAKTNDSALPFPQPPLHPTTELKFVSINYRIEICCAFSWCSDVQLEFQLGIHQPPLVPMVPAQQPPL